MLVCFEGIDAAGKATQSRLLAKAMGPIAEVISFPKYTTLTGNALYDHLRDRWGIHHVDDRRARQLDALVFQALQTVNRLEQAALFQDLQRLAIPVVLDRYWPSGVVHGTLDGLPQDWLIQIHQLLPQPEIFFLLDVSPEDSLLRRPQRRDRIESNMPLMSAVGGRYRTLWQEMRNRGNEFGGSVWHVVNGRGTIRDVHERILNTIGPRFPFSSLSSVDSVAVAGPQP